MAKQRARLDALAAPLPHGDPARGAAIFTDAKSLCITCHTLGGAGASFGPDLTKIGAIRSERDLLEAIVYPGASLVRSFEPVIVRTRGGEQMGLVRKDAADEVILAVAPGAEVRIPRGEVIETQFSSTSLMPSGFDGLLTPQEIADLIAYLRSAK
jgi:putative heme-binding domain-containing protein